MVPAPAGRRLALLVGGLALVGFSVALMVVASLGLAPWAVLDQGLARTSGLSIGALSIIVGAVVLLAWVPLRQRPGLGTMCNVVLVGIFIDASLAVLTTPHSLTARVLTLVLGIVLNAVGTGAYIGASLGPGPRDGLSTAIAARGHSLRLMRTIIEIGALAAGWLLGGTVGFGTLAYALVIGPLIHLAIPWMTLRPQR